jgi:hypothetical protein
MKFAGELTVKAPRAQVYKAVRDARFFASCVDGVRDLQETAPDTYAAVFETKVAYMKFSFKVTVEVVRADEPREIEAKVEGTPLGIIGRLTATSLTTLTEAGDETKVAYMKFSFKVTVEVVRADEPREIEAKVEGTPLGIIGRLTATSLTTLTEAGDETKIAYEVEAALTGKLGSLGQPVLRSKAKEMERQFAARLAAAFAPQTTP